MQARASRGPPGERSCVALTTPGRGRGQDLSEPWMLLAAQNALTPWAPLRGCPPASKSLGQKAEGRDKESRARSRQKEKGTVRLRLKWPNLAEPAEWPPRAPCPPRPTPDQGLFMPDLMFLLTHTPTEITTHRLQARKFRLREVE